RSFTNGTLSVEKVSGAVDLPTSSTVTVTAADDGKVARGTISTKVSSTDLKSFTVTLKITGQGLQAREVKSKDIIIKAN
ncbi:MAG: hypothetical protein J0626_06470, partial [Rhodospirillaceae bacterium]|nr:hypothetical protein [Rhodospirillaceae bacterium]